MATSVAGDDESYSAFRALVDWAFDNVDVSFDESVIARVRQLVLASPAFDEILRALTTDPSSIVARCSSSGMYVSPVLLLCVVQPDTELTNELRFGWLADSESVMIRRSTDPERLLAEDLVGAEVDRARSCRWTFDLSNDRRCRDDERGRYSASALLPEIAARRHRLAFLRDDFANNSEDFDARGDRDDFAQLRSLLFCEYDAASCALLTLYERHAERYLSERDVEITRREADASAIDERVTNELGVAVERLYSLNELHRETYDALSQARDRETTLINATQAMRLQLAVRQNDLRAQMEIVLSQIQTDVAVRVDRAKRARHEKHRELLEHERRLADECATLARDVCRVLDSVLERRRAEAVSMRLTAVDATIRGHDFARGFAVAGDDDDDNDDSTPWSCDRPSTKLNLNADDDECIQRALRHENEVVDLSAKCESSGKLIVTAIQDDNPIELDAIISRCEALSTIPTQELIRAQETLRYERERKKRLDLTRRVQYAKLGERANKMFRYINWRDCVTIATETPISCTEQEALRDYGPWDDKLQPPKSLNRYDKKNDEFAKCFMKSAFDPATATVASCNALSDITGCRLDDDLLNDIGEEANKDRAKRSLRCSLFKYGLHMSPVEKRGIRFAYIVASCPTIDREPMPQSSR